MNLIFIYGPPATGKLTVAKELIKTIDYKLLHHHLIYDLVHSVFGDRDSGDLYSQICLEVFQRAIKSDISGVVFTFVYGLGYDNSFIESVTKFIRDSGGQTYFVQLFCDKSELLKRVTQPSRQQFDKLKDPEKLKQLFTQYDILTPIPNVDSLTIDNTTQTPAKVAQKIISSYHLK